MTAPDTTAPLTWAYVASATGTVLGLVLLVVALGWALDRLCGLYDKDSTTLSGRTRRSTSPNPERPTQRLIP